MPRGTTLRNIRVPDDLWDAVLRKADDEGRNASEVVREYLNAWVLRPPHMEANAVLDLYVKYVEYDNAGDGKYDEAENETLRWDFIDSAVELLNVLTGRNVGDE